MWFLYGKSFVCPTRGLFVKTGLPVPGSRNMQKRQVTFVRQDRKAKKKTLSKLD